MFRTLRPRIRFSESLIKWKRPSFRLPALFTPGASARACIAKPARRSYAARLSRSRSRDERSRGPGKHHDLSMTIKLLIPPLCLAFCLSALAQDAPMTSVLPPADAGGTPGAAIAPPPAPEPPAPPPVPETMGPPSGAHTPDNAQSSLAPSWETQKTARTYVLQIPAPRGQITDRNGRPLAQTRVSYNLALNFPTSPSMTDDRGAGVRARADGTSRTACSTRKSRCRTRQS